MFCCILLHVDCPPSWVETPDVHGIGGTQHSATDLPACQSACIDDNTCVAIDWDTGRARGLQCWLQTSKEITTTTRDGVITHYELRRDCVRS